MWTDPAALQFQNGAKVGATVLNREIRDNLRFLHDPPSALATHDSNQTISKDDALSDFYVLDFSRTVKDTGEIHGGGDIGPYPATAGMRTTIAGAWLQQAIVPFDVSYLSEREIKGLQFTGGIAVVDGFHRSSHARTNSQGDARGETIPWVRIVPLPANDIRGVGALSMVEDSQVVSLVGIRQPLHGMHWLGGS